jgi:triacylglycerol lipase
VLGVATLSFATEARAQNPFQRGPNPTVALLEASAGPFAVQTENVSAAVAGFGGGTIYFPSQANTYGVIAMCPGFTASSSSLAWLGRRVASHGFVVIVINTNSRFDFPTSRATQLAAGLNHVVNGASAAVRSRADGNRRGVGGHSMGGGGTLIASRSNPSLRAGVPLTPWNNSSSFQTVSVPQFIFGAENDSVAGVNQHAIPFFNALPAALDKVYSELNNASHGAPTSTNTPIGRYTVAWYKRFVDNDTRYTEFLCGATAEADKDNAARYSDFRDTCPL